MKINVTQYKRPNGAREVISVEVSDDVGVLARQQVLSCEIVPGNKVALYGRLRTQEEEDEITLLADNCLDPNDPNSPTFDYVPGLEDGPHRPPEGGDE